MAEYVPAKGDFIAITFNPQSGHEQQGRRPALVASNFLFNQKTGLALVCPITNTDRKSPLHVKVPPLSVLTGFIMVEQIKSVDFSSRNAKFIDKADSRTLNEVLALLDAILYE